MSTAPDRAAVLTELGRTLHSLWRLGSHALIGWTETRSGIEVLTMPKIRLFSAGAVPRRTFAGERRMGPATFEQVRAALGLQPIELRLDLPVGDDPGKIAPTEIERYVAPYAVTRTERRAVALIDIVGFSKFDPHQQASQLATLEFALNLAAETAVAHGLEVDIGRSTTGDGFYVWNSAKGLRADEDLFALAILFMLFSEAMRRSIEDRAMAPEIRLCLGVGSHFTYRQAARGGPTSSEFIVGEATITLARLMSSARPGQILVADFVRAPDGDGPPIEPQAFLRRVVERLGFASSLSLLGNPIASLKTYLTGPKRTDGSFGVQRLRVTDKHGLAHDCFNLKINAHLHGTEPLYCGHRHQDVMRQS